MKASIVLLPGDGIGPEIVTPARQVLELIGQLYQHHFELHEALIEPQRFASASADIELMSSG